MNDYLSVEMWKLQDIHTIDTNHVHISAKSISVQVLLPTYHSFKVREPLNQKIGKLHCMVLPCLV